MCAPAAQARLPKKVAPPAAGVDPGTGRHPAVRRIRWVNDLAYEGLSLSAIYEEDPHPDGEGVRQFVYLVGRSIDRKNCWNVAAAARLRWRCENEGFNVLKKGGFALEHVYSRNLNASKGYVMMMPIAHLFQQLLAHGRLRAVFDVAFHTFRYLAQCLLDALKLLPLPENLGPPGQIRLNSA